MQGGAIDGPWPAGERLLACVGPDAQSDAVLRRAKRLADQAGARLIVATVERAGRRPRRAAEARLADTLKLAESLGAETKTLFGHDIPDAILRFARFENVTQIVIGRSRSGVLPELFRRSLPHELVRRAGGISIHVLTDDAGGRPRRKPDLELGPLRPLEFAWAATGVALATLVGEGLTSFIALPNVSIIYLMAVLGPAVLFGVWPAVFASGLSFLAYNFFFIPPVYTFTVARPHELLALFVFLVIAVITSAVAGRAREQARASAARVRATRRLYEFTRRLSGVAGREAVAEVAAAEIHASTRRGAVLVRRGFAGPEVVAAWPPELLDDAALAAALWAAERDEPAGSGTGTLPQVPWLFLPLRGGEGPFGAAGIALAPGQTLGGEERALLDSLVEQTAAALQRTVLAEESAAARTAAETERVRNTLLSSISHDFRTPLAAILGAASTLAELGERMDGNTRDELLQQIREEAEHLDGMVRNLLAMTRVEAGALEPSRTWIDTEELARRVVAAARRRGARQRIAVEVAPGLPLVHADQGLVEQALSNLIGNAVRHAGATASIVVTLRREPDHLAVDVADDGPGIPADLLPRVFDKFVRARPAADGGEGTGLGLAIARGIAQAHGGTLSVASPAPSGKGARFTLSLPVEGGSGS